MYKPPKEFRECPYCLGLLPVALDCSRAGPRIYQPKESLRCICGYGQTVAYQLSLAAELSFLRAARLSRSARAEPTG